MSKSHDTRNPFKNQGKVHSTPEDRQKRPWRDHLEEDTIVLPDGREFVYERRFYGKDPMTGMGVKKRVSQDMNNFVCCANLYKLHPPVYGHLFHDMSLIEVPDGLAVVCPICLEEYEKDGKWKKRLGFLYRPPNY